MNIKCHCLYCPTHPLHDQRNKLVIHTGSVPPSSDNDDTAREVACFLPTNSKIEDGKLDEDDLVFPHPFYYWDGYGATEANWDGDDIQVFCDHEEYEE